MSRPQLESLPATSGCQYMDFCCGRSPALVLGSVMGFLSSTHPTPPPARTVMGRREEAKFNRSTSHDCSTNAAIQEPVCIKQHTCHCARALRMRIFYFSLKKCVRKKKNQERSVRWSNFQVAEQEFSSSIGFIAAQCSRANLVGATKHKRLVG